MKLPTAIDVLDALLHVGPQFSQDDRIAAVKIGIEAIKSIERERHGEITHHDWILPGETKD